jgi:hypothetical protein
VNGGKGGSSNFDSQHSVRETSMVQGGSLLEITYNTLSEMFRSQGRQRSSIFDSQHILLETSMVQGGSLLEITYTVFLKCLEVKGGSEAQFLTASIVFWRHRWCKGDTSRNHF